MTEFRKYSHVRRFGTDGTEGYLNGHVIVTPKVDGANCVIFFDTEKNSPVIAGRNTVCSSPDDNSWLGAWFDDCSVDNKNEAYWLRKFVTDHPNIIIYGEWMGGWKKDKFQGAIKDYNKEALRSVRIFDMFNTNLDIYVADHAWRLVLETEYPALLPYIVPILAEFDNPTEDQLWEVAKNNNYLLEETGHPGEGIVLRNPDFKDELGNYHIVKMVLSDWRKNANKQQRDKIAEDIHAAIIEEYMSDAEMSKTIQKTCAKFDDDEFDATSPKHMGFFTSVIFKDLVEENIMDMMKRFKKPTIDFDKLSDLATARGKQYLRDNGYMK